MFLKRLESMGFKSFAERINIQFVRGVTVIVGPNGSGKSNITDAIRWVLGEQSVRSLRGLQMEDIIFQGSHHRSPLNVAEVTLVLDNESQTLPIDYEEVSVTRRVYRSGASEFYINKQACRLRDIIELFMDSGIGQEAFSIISQGKVEEILSSKAEERRLIFEEAAGVLKYKQRKHKAGHKLTETKENLTRIHDIFYEVKAQIEPIREQADKAKKYLHIKEQLHDEEIRLLITEIESMHTKWEALSKELLEKQHIQMQLQTEKTSVETNILNDRHTIHQMDQQIEKQQKALLGKTKELEQLEGQKLVSKERLKHLTENKQSLQIQLNDMDMEIKDFKRSLDNETHTLHNLRKKKEKQIGEVESLKVQLQRDEINPAKIEELKSYYIDLLSEQAQLKNEMKYTKKNEQQQLVEMNRLSDLFDTQTENKLQMATQLDNIERKIMALKKIITEKEQDIADTAMKVDDLNKQVQSLNQKGQKEENQIVKMTSKLDMLQSMRTNYDGFYHGVKSILKSKSQFPHVYGAVLELIEVPSKYVTAIETVLGNQAQHIVVPNEQAARKMIDWLKQTSNGRVTFLPLNIIKPRYIHQRLLGDVKSQQGFIGVCADLVTADDKFLPLIQYLMGNVIISDNLKHANDIAKLLSYQYRVVSLEGDVIHSGGSMTGGSRSGRNESLFTRDKELNQVQQSIHQIKDDHNKTKEKLKSLLSHVHELNQLLVQDKHKLQEHLKQLQHLQTEQNKCDIEMKSIERNMRICEMDKKATEAELGVLSVNAKKMEENITKLNLKIGTTNKQIHHLEEKKTNERVLNEENQQEVHTLEISIAEIEERIKNQQGKITSIKFQIDKSDREKNKKKEKLNKLDDRTLAEYVIKLEQQINDTKLGKDKLIMQLNDDKKQRQNKQRHIHEMENNAKEINRMFESAIQEVKQKELLINRYDISLNNLLETLQDKYNTSYERAVSTYEKVSDVTESKEKVSQLNEAIDQLGTINIGAIKEHERLSERYTFLNEQQQDLTEAKETLHQMIAEMDEEMEKRFENTFIQINEAFQHVFQELFGGGMAELRLTNPNELLDTGVDIIAQPPGKKFQHLNLLSGGEKALTAIALLFAILKVRPVPFCVLDEVEAALDEANVVRFAKYLDYHSDDTQFIVITHRKGTMEEADALYGVTMQEPGVSRLVSVRLEDQSSLVSQE